MATTILHRKDSSVEFGDKQLHTVLTDSITGFKKLLGIGPKSGTLCNKMLSHEYLSVTLNDFSTSLEWLQKRMAEKRALPDAILYDLDLDKENTFKNVKKLKQLCDKCNITVILITEQIDDAERIEALKAGADDYYSKFVSTEDLNYRILFLKKLTGLITESSTPKQVKESGQVRIWGMKRIFDLLVAVPMLIVLSPILMVITLLIKFDSKGPVFYISKRAGTGYRVFNFYKFRTMKTGADKELEKLKDQNQYSDSGDDALFFKIDEDPRVTKIGSFLRNTSLDELPQILNVIKGDMSLVGNRPLPLYEAMQLTRDQWAMRFNAPAGITGLWQVTKRGQSNMSEEERIKLDISYAKRNSFLYDIKILFKTLPAAIQKENV